MADETWYLKRTSDIHRKALGQFFTPQPVAEFMVRWVLGSGHARIFDPAFGLGAFHRAAVRAGCERFEGSEIDPEILQAWRSQQRTDGAIVANEDYLTSWGRQHTNVVCNPPYMRFQRFVNRSEVLASFSRELNLKLSGYTNTASAFLLKSLAELDGAGRLAYLMPLEFMNAGYGAAVKEQLLASGRLRAVVSLRCEQEVFPGVITSAGILLCDAACPSREVDFHAINALDALEGVLDRRPVTRVRAGSLAPGDKWLSYLSANRRAIRRATTVRISQYGHFSRGIATGANEFFVLRPSRAAALGLRSTETVPCIARSKQVNGPLFDDSALDSLLKRDAPVLLMKLDTEPSACALRYVREGEAQGFHKRYLTRTRRPWYRTEFRKTSPLLMGVFSRGGYKVVRNHTSALNLTCFHGFQPNLFGAGFLDQLFLYLASAIGRETLSLSMRRYGDSLDKFEPNDLNVALAPGPAAFQRLGTQDLARALAVTRDRGEAPDWINSFFAEIQDGDQSVPPVQAPIAGALSVAERPMTTHGRVSVP